MISKPRLSYSVIGGNLFTRECCHDVICVLAIGSTTQGLLFKCSSMILSRTSNLLSLMQLR